MQQSLVATHENNIIYSLQAELENAWLCFTHNLTSPQTVPFQIYCFNTAAAANVALRRSKELCATFKNFFHICSNATQDLQTDFDVWN